MTPPPTRPRLLDALWVVLVAVASSAWCMTSAAHLGATFDEPFYVAKGLEKWRTGSNRELLRVGTMPLPVDVQTLPLHLWERLRGQPFDAVNDLPTLLPVARAMTLPFWWALLAYSYLLARRWGGEWAGRLAVALVGCEPNLLAHAALATTDIAVAAAVLASVSHLLDGQGGPWWKRVLLPGVLTGLAVACKASALTFVPIAFVAVAAWREGVWRQLRTLLAIAVVATVTLFTYCGTDWAPQRSFVEWANGLPDGPTATALRTTADALRIFPNAGEGIASQVKHNIRGHGCYVLGEWHPRAVWYYFPVVLSAKLSEPLLLLLAGLLVLRPRQLWNPAGRVALALLLFSLTCRVQIGVRLMFPLVAFLNVAAAVAVANSFNGGGRIRWASAGIVGAVVLAAGFAWPDGLKHMNRFWGGPDRSAEVLTDSNYDWGQGLPELRRWNAANGDSPLAVWYYGADPDVYREPLRLVQVNEMAEPSVAELKQRAGTRHLAVGVSLLTGCPDRRPETLAVLEWLKAQPVVARVGTFVVYELADR